MSAFGKLTNRHCDRYAISSLDRAKFFLHYPFFRCLHILDYGTGKSKKIASMVYPWIKNHRFRYKAKCASGKIFASSVLFDLHDLASIREVLMSECYALPDYVSDVEVIVDLGGNTGTASLYFLMNLPKVRQIVIVEANPALIPTISSNLAPFSDKVTVENVCVGDGSSSSIEFTVDANHRHSHTGASMDSNAKSVVRLSCVTLRHLMDKHGIAEADLLKMDIEGAKFGVLHDREILRRFRFMHIEVHGPRDKRDLFVQSVQELGFEISPRNDAENIPCEEIFCSRI